jgi:hypothetical protein
MECMPIAVPPPSITARVTVKPNLKETTIRDVAGGRTDNFGLLDRSVKRSFSD